MAPEDGIAADAQELADEAHDAAVTDANLARLRTVDADAERLFTGVSFTEALIDPSRYKELGDAIEAFGAAKHAQGRMDIFGSLFVGTVGFDPSDWPLAPA